MSEALLNRALQGAFSLGLAVSAGLLAAGLLLERDGLLRIGVVALLTTPAAGVLVVAAAMLSRRDWAFAAISLWILGVLFSSAWVAIRL